MRNSNATLEQFSKEKACCIPFLPLLKNNAKFYRRYIYLLHCILKAPFMRLIGFYQKHLSRHTCLYQPTCSEYTKRCINNVGVIFGILLGIWRILRCNPLSKGGVDPAPELWYKKKWLI